MNMKAFESLTMDDHKKLAIENIDIELIKLSRRIRVALHLGAMSEQEMSEYVERRGNEILEVTMGKSEHDFETELQKELIGEVLARVL